MIISIAPLIPAVIGEVLLSIFTWMINWVLSVICQGIAFLLSAAVNFLWELLSGELITTINHSSISNLISGDIYTASKSIGVIIAVAILLFQLLKILQDTDGKSESFGSLIVGFCLSVACLLTLPVRLFMGVLFNGIFVHLGSVFSSFSGIISGSFAMSTDDIHIYSDITMLETLSGTYFEGLLGDIVGTITTVLEGMVSLMGKAIFCVIMFYILKFLAKRCINLMLSILNRLALVYILIFVCPMAMGTLVSKSTRQTFSGWLKLYLGNIVSLFFSMAFIQVAFNILVNSFAKASQPGITFISALVEVGIGLVLIEIVINIESYVQQLALGGVNTAHMMTYVARDLIHASAGMGAALKSLFSGVSSVGDLAGEANEAAAEGGNPMTPIAAAVNDKMDSIAAKAHDLFSGNGAQNPDEAESGKTLDNEGKSSAEDGSLKAKANAVDAYNQAQEADAEAGSEEEQNAYDSGDIDAAGAGEAAADNTQMPDNIDFNGDGTYASDENGTLQKVDGADVDAGGNQNRYNEDGMADKNGNYVMGENGELLAAGSMRTVNQNERQKQDAAGSIPKSINYRGAGVYAKDSNGTLCKVDGTDADASGNQNRYNEDGMADENGAYIKGENGELLAADSMQAYDFSAKGSDADASGTTGQEDRTGTQQMEKIPDEGRFESNDKSYYKTPDGNYGTSNMTGKPVRIPDDALNKDGTIKDSARVDAQGTPNVNGKYVATGNMAHDPETGSFGRNEATGRMEPIAAEAFDENGEIAPDARFGDHGEYVTGANGQVLHIGARNEDLHTPELAKVTDDARSNMYDPAWERMPASKGESGLWEAQKSANMSNANLTRGREAAFIADEKGSYAKDSRGNMHAIDPAAIRNDGTIAPQQLRDKTGQISAYPLENHYVASAGSGEMLDTNAGRFANVPQSMFASPAIAIASDTGNMLRDDNGVAHAITKSLDNNGHIRSGVQRYDGRGYETANGAYIKADDGTMVEAFRRTANGVDIPASEVLEEGKTMEKSSAGRGFSVTSTEFGAADGRSSLVSGTATAMDNAGTYGIYRMAQASDAIGHNSAVARDMDGNICLVSGNEVAWRADGSVAAADRSRISEGNAGYFYTTSGGMHIPCDRDGGFKDAGKAFENSYSNASGAATYADSVSGHAVDVSSVLNFPGGSRVKDNAQFMRQTTLNGNPVFKKCSMSEASHVAVSTPSGETYVPVNVSSDSTGHPTAQIDQTYQPARRSGAEQQIAHAAAAVSGYTVQNRSTWETAQTAPAVAYDPARNSVYIPQTGGYSKPTEAMPKWNINNNSADSTVNTGIFYGNLDAVRQHRNKDKADAGIYTALMKTVDGEKTRVEMYDARSSEMASLWADATQGRKKVHGYVPRENGDVGYWIVSNANNGRSTNSRQKR